MRRRRLDDAAKARLCAAWHSTARAEDIAAAENVGMTTLWRVWHAAMRAGRLPAESRAGRVSRVRLRSRAAVIKPVRVPDDDTPIAAPNPRTDRQCAALLKALRLHHAAADNARAHVVPAAWLKGDVDPYHAPAEVQLRAMMRALDQNIIEQGKVMER